MIERKASFTWELPMYVEKKDGLVFHAQPKVAKSGKVVPDWMVVAVQDGKIAVSLNYGSGEGVAYTPAIELKKWFTLKVDKKNQDFELFIDGKSVGKGRTQHNSKTLDIEKYHFMGKDVEHQDNWVKTKAHTEVPFKGCFGDLKVQNKKYTPIKEEKIKDCPHDPEGRKSTSA